MTAHALEVRITQGQSRVAVLRFNRTLSRVATSLNEVDVQTMTPGIQKITWLVDDLDHQGRDLTVRLVPRLGSRGRTVESVMAPIDALVNGIAALQGVPEVPEFYRDQTVTRLVKLGQPGQGVERVTLAAVNGKVGPDRPLNDQVLANAQTAVRPVETANGSVVGRLDIVNARAEKILRVSLFDVVSKRAITGIAPARLRNEIHSHFEHRVLAEGQVTRNERGQIVKVAIERFERLPDDNSERASVMELLGADPDWIGGQNVDEYIREARRG